MWKIGIKHKKYPGKILIFVPEIRSQVIMERQLVSHEMAALTDALLTMVSSSIHFGRSSEARDIAILQLRSFMIAYACWLERHGQAGGRHVSRSTELYFRFMHLLKSHFRESRQVSFYAGKMNMTSKYLNGIILEQTGKTAKAAIDDYVTMQIKHTIITTDMTVNETAWLYNFSSPSFFCDYFRRHVGLSPSAYREQTK